MWAPLPRLLDGFGMDLVHQFQQPLELVIIGDIWREIYFMDPVWIWFIVPVGISLVRIIVNWRHSWRK